MTEFGNLVGIDAPKADPIPAVSIPVPEKVTDKPKVKEQPKQDTPKAKAKSKAKPKAQPAKKAGKKAKKKTNPYIVRKKKSVAVKTDTGLGPAFKDDDGNIIKIDIDEGYVKRLVAETVNVTVPEGVASQEILPQYVCYTRIYDIFNAVFFGNELDPVMLVFQEMRTAQGYFRHTTQPKGGIWSDGKKKLDEIGLNPLVHFTLFAEGKGDRAISTLLHEMVHKWEFSSAVASDNKIPRDNYHGKVFAEKMESLGLITTNTGKEGGARTGRTITHYIEKDGPFEQVYKLLPEELLWPWKGPKATRGREVKPITKPKIHRSRNKVKYECPMIHELDEKGDRKCDTVVWSKPDREGYLACLNHDNKAVPLKAVNNPQ